MSGKPGQNLLLFVHSSIDDAGLTPTGFSVFNHRPEWQYPDCRAHILLFMGYFLVRSQSWRCPVSWYLQNQVDQNALEGFYRSIYETAVMRALASFANDDGDSCRPALNTLAQRSQCSERKVKRVLKVFRERRWITVKATGRSNHYRILPHGFVVPTDASPCARTHAGWEATKAFREASLSHQKGHRGLSERPQRPTTLIRDSRQ